MPTKNLQLKIVALCFKFVVLSLLVACAPNLRAQDADEAQLNEAVAEFQRGQDAHEKGDLSAALKFYDKAVELNPEFPEAEYQRAAALQQIGKTTEAEISLRRALALRADWSLALAKLGALLVQKSFQNNEENAQIARDEAAGLLGRAVALDANNYPAFVALAELRLREPAPPDARRALLAQIRNITDGKSNAPAQIWTARAALERSLDDLTAAKISIARALQTQPNSVAARLERAALALRENDFATAGEDVKFVIGTEPKNLEAQLLQAQIFAGNNRRDEAAKILDSLPTEQKNLPAVAKLRNQILINNAADATDAATLEKALVSDPKNAILLGKLCVLTRAASPAKALEYCRQANLLEPANAAHAVNFGAALVQARRFADAITVLNQVLTVVPNNTAARANLATALYESKRYPEAIIEFNRLLEAQPDSAVSHYFLATAHDAQGDYTDALAAYQKFLALADAQQNQLEIDKVNLRLPILKRQIEKGAGKKKTKN